MIKDIIMREKRPRSKTWRAWLECASVGVNPTLLSPGAICHPVC
jgi:hypothetical protein